MLVWMLMLLPCWLAECRLLEADAMAGKTAPNEQADVYLTNSERRSSDGRVTLQTQPESTSRQLKSMASQ
jgi:hypothetical protein